MVAQVQAAKGEQYVYRIDRDENGKETHVLLTDGHEIGRALDAISAGTFEDKYYYISTKPASTIAFKELLDRGFGKAKEIKKVDVNVQLSLSRLAQQALMRGKNKNDGSTVPTQLRAPEGILRGQIIHEISESVEND